MGDDWVYHYSKILEMKYAVNRKDGRVMTEDKVMYTREEIENIARDNGEITPELHAVKKEMEGRIVQ